MSYAPIIHGLSSYQSPAGANTVVSITGQNFFSYSSIVFGTFRPTVYFINSLVLQFYVPNTLNSGDFPVQVFNGSIGSNTVVYTIDNASGYWILNSNGTISNTNSGLCTINALSRNVPYIINDSNTYVVPDNVSWIICDNEATEDVHVTLPAYTEYTGREITFKNIGNGLVQNTDANVVPFTGGSGGTQIVGINGWVTLVYTGSVWITMQQGYF
jgi:hypothetical protein